MFKTYQGKQEWEHFHVSVEGDQCYPLKKYNSQVGTYTKQKTLF